MKTVFIGGSRRVSRLNSDVRHRLDQIIASQLQVVLGDANGTDKAVQAYFKDRSYPHVIIFCTAGRCRNNLGDWPVEAIAAPHKTKDFEFYTAKDAAMARAADVGFMIWDGESSGTMVNVARLVGSGKPAVLYVAPAKLFRTVRSSSQLEEILGDCPTEVRDRIHRYASGQAYEHAH